MRCQLRTVATAVFGSLFLVGVSGCQYSFPFEFSGVVRAADGAPLPGVTVTLNADYMHESAFPVVSGADGKFKAAVRIAGSAFTGGDLPTWSLELSKKGFATTTIDVSPKHRPESPRKTTFVSVEGTLKAK